MAGRIEARLAELGIVLPEAGAPRAAKILTAKISGDWMYVSGAVPRMDGEIRYVGKVGREFSLEEGQAAARLSALNMLAHARKALDGDLDRVRDIVNVRGFINIDPDFIQVAETLNGASEVLIEIFGDRGPPRPDRRRGGGDAVRRRDRGRGADAHRSRLTARAACKRGPAGPRSVSRRSRESPTCSASSTRFRATTGTSRSTSSRSARWCATASWSPTGTPSPIPRVEGRRRAQYRLIGVGGSGKPDPHALPAGGFTLSMLIVPPGQGGSAHTHEVEEAFVVLEGELTVFFQDETGRQAGNTLGQYEVALCPAGIPHGFVNQGDKDALIQIMIGSGEPGPIGFVGRRHLPRGSRPADLARPDGGGGVGSRQTVSRRDVPSLLGLSPTIGAFLPVTPDLFRGPGQPLQHLPT